MRSEFIHRLVSLAAELADSVPGGKTSSEELGPNARWYASSWQRAGGIDVFLARDGVERCLVVAGAGPEAARVPGEVVATGERPVKVAAYSSEACATLRALFPWTAPRALPKHRPSFGCGDRLGVATPGQLRGLRHTRAALVLAQQSVRELTLTGRSYAEVVDAATWGVFQEGYQEGFGADGDHLKTADEVRALLDAGATFITLDLSLCLGCASSLPEMPDAVRRLEGNSWELAGERLEANPDDLRGFWRVYGPTFAFIEEADVLCRQARGVGGYDLEVSVDETAHATRPLDHLLLATELARRGIAVTSIAPRFPGEFQKGIDYIGDRERLEREVAIHAEIAHRFGYKLGVHSGSDKFAVFPLFGRHGGDRLHVKTAGTSWLEALRVVAATDPALFRAIWTQATEGFPRAREYYHIGTSLADVTGKADVPDSELPHLLNDDACRQFLHITYGEILKAPAPGGGTLSDALQENLAQNEARYAHGLEAHFRRHADGLGLTSS